MQDTTQSFMITLVGEGIGTLYGELWVANTSTAIDYRYDLATSTWLTDLPIAYPGNSIDIIYEVRNTGVLVDTLYTEFISAEVTPVETSPQVFTDVGVGSGPEVHWNFTMPATNVNITLNAGHEE